MSLELREIHFSPVGGVSVSYLEEGVSVFYIEGGVSVQYWREESEYSIGGVSN